MLSASKLIDQIARCRDFLPVLRDPAARKTVEDLMRHLKGIWRNYTLLTPPEGCRDSLVATSALMQVHPLTSDAERIDLLVRISRCRDLLAVLREAGARKT